MSEHVPNREPGEVVRVMDTPSAPVGMKNAVATVVGVEAPWVDLKFPGVREPVRILLAQVGGAMLKSDNELRDELMRGKHCPACEHRKRKKRSLCYACYMALPNHYRNSLYDRIGQGYALSYHNALLYLRGGSDLAISVTANQTP